MLRLKLVLFLLIVFSISCFSQTKLDMDSLATNLQPYLKNVPKENIYLQTSKGIYESGEDLWFKAYVLNAQSFIPSMLSQTLYLQLIDESTRKALWQEMYEIKNGFADGQVYLPDSLAEGNYLLEAFTANSFFADSVQFKALRKIRVVKSYTSIIASAGLAEVPDKKTSIQFNVFPEGGKLINEIPAKLAFKAVNLNGEPVQVSGTLFQDDQALQSFRSEHAGMGSLAFTPISGKKYHIRLSEPAKDSIFQLPKVYAEGISLSLMGRDSSNLIFAVERVGGTTAKVYLRGQLRGKTACIASGLLDKQLTIKLPLKEFTQQGIAEFTLFNEILQPIAERLVYVNAEKKLFIKTELSKQQFKLREKATLKISVSDQSGHPVQANLGLSVSDKLYNNPKDAKNVLTHYYLSSQLKGRIRDPAFYFDEKQLNREIAMDLLLLTQGWRNYVWSEDNLEQYKSGGQPVVSEGIAGEVRFTKKLKQAPQGMQFLTVFTPDEKGTTKHSSFIESDVAGNFKITSQDLKGAQGNYLYINPVSAVDFAPRISMDMPFSAINKRVNRSKLSYPLADGTGNNKIEPLKPYETRPISVKLNEVVVKASGTNVFRDKYLGKLDSLAKLEINTDYVCILGNVLNCFIHNKDTSKKPINGEHYYVHIGKKGEILGADYPLKGWFGTRHYVYYNPNLNFTEEELLKRNNLTRIKGYYAEKEFYQPNYDKESADDVLPDARNTLLWAPNVITDKNGEATLSFYTSDINTGFIGKIEGVNGEGLLGLGGFEFLVRKTDR